MKPLRNQAGQMILEMILILTILLSLTLVTARYFKDNEIVAQLISGPWLMLSGMIQNGVWMPAGQADSFHPNFAARGASLKGIPTK